MSITVNIYYKGENGNAKKFAEEMEASGIANKVREQAGNERYEYFYPANDNETVLLIDRWRDQEAIDIHHKSPMMKQIADLRSKYKLKMRVEKFCELK
ncbi:MAG: antibiotic biosynthesis monooxygenase [Clostridia bacterium]|nr:antibiotic biosynthesis monooxygenase [Clostridia bacterium]